MNGILLIDKPEGFTSFDVIAVVRKLTSQRKTGHTGTLDPNATGVLPVLLGSATKAQDLIPNHDKSYRAEFALGTRTDTLDIWGKVLEQKETHITRDELVEKLRDFRGEIEQLPPMFSAVQKDGQRLYDLARKGIEVEREKRRVKIYRLELTGFDEEKQSGTLEVSCSRGTYIRSLIDDLGKALGHCAVMTALRRTEACGYKLEDCAPLERLRQMSAEDIAALVRPTESLFCSYPSVSVTQNQAKRFKNGGALDISRTELRGRVVPDKSVFRIKGSDGGFLGLGITDSESGLIKIYKLFSEKN